MKKCFLDIFPFFFFFVVSCTSLEIEPVVFHVDNMVVEKDEFMKRASFVPHLRQSTDPDQVKQDVLASLIAEKILSKEALSLGLDTLETLSAQIKQLEKEAVFEYWVQQTVDKTIEVSPSEVHEAYNRSKQTRVVDYWIEPDSLLAEILIDSLIQSRNKQSTEMSDIFSSAQEKIIQFGEAWGPVEDAVYALKQGEVSTPVKVDDEYYVFRLKSIKQSLTTASDFESQRAVLQNKVWERKRTAKYEKEANQNLQGAAFKIKREQYDRIISTLAQRLTFPAEEDASFPIQSAILEFPEVQTDLRSQLEYTFVQFKSGRIWTVGDFLKNLAYGPYLLNYKNREMFRRDVPRILHKMVLLETVAEMGNEAGYREAPYVKKRKQMWHDHLLASAIQARCSDSVRISQEEINHYYESHSDQFSSEPQRKIQEILVPTRELAVNLIQRIQAGESMDDLARNFSIRPTASADGFSPFLGLNDWGAVSRKAFQLPLQALYGPLQTEDDNYSILQVIEIESGKLRPLSEVHSEILRILTNEKNIQILNQLIESKLPESEIEINESVLKTINVSNIQMLVTKSHFPGRLVVPFPIPIRASESWFKNLVKE